MEKIIHDMKNLNLPIPLPGDKVKLKNDNNNYIFIGINKDNQYILINKDAKQIYNNTFFCENKKIENIN
jgi:hypothetical protein